MSVHVVFNEIIPDPSAKYFSELERLKIEVDPESRDPKDNQFLVGLQHIDDEDGLVYVTTRVTVRKGCIVAYRQLVTTADSKPREESTPIHVADVARMTAALQNFPPNPPDDSVSSALSTPCNTPVARRQSISFNPDRVVGAPQSVPLPSSLVPGWNSQGRLATDTPAEKRMRLFQELPVKTNLASEFSLPSKQGGRKRRSCVNTLPLLCLHVSCPQSYSQALKSPEVAAWKESITAELHVLQDKRRCWKIVLYTKGLRS